MQSVLVSESLDVMQAAWCMAHAPAHGQAMHGQGTSIGMVCVALIILCLPSPRSAVAPSPRHAHAEPELAQQVCGMPVAAWHVHSPTGWLYLHRCTHFRLSSHKLGATWLTVCARGAAACGASQRSACWPARCQSEAACTADCFITIQQ